MPDKEVVSTQYTEMVGKTTVSRNIILISGDKSREITGEIISENDSIVVIKISK